jgi:hypothetical protein
VAGRLDGEREAVLAGGDHGCPHVGRPGRFDDHRRTRVDRGGQRPTLLVVAVIARQIYRTTDDATQPASHSIWC